MEEEIAERKGEKGRRRRENNKEEIAERKGEKEKEREQ